MKLQSIELHPFAGIAERTIAFSDGLTVILGPNEAGKTATVNALLASIYDPVKLTKSAREKFGQRFFPTNGGTYASVTLEFEHNGNHCILEKKWSATPDFRFIYGSRKLDQESAWEEFLKKHFFPDATAKNILVISQMKLSETLHSLQEDKNSVAGLGEALRRTVLSTDGISIDLLQRKLDETVKSWFAHWDSGAGKPEKRKDIDNPWQKEIGVILKSYYDKRKVEEELRSAAQYELRVDAVNKQVFVLQQKQHEADEFINRQGEAYKGARERQMKSEQIKRIGLELQELRTVQKEWPKNEGRLELLQESVKENDGRNKTLQEELQRAEEFLQLREQAEKYRKLQAAEKSFTAKREQMSELTEVPKQALQKSDELHQAIAVNAVKLESQKLRVKVTALEDTAMSVGQTKESVIEKRLAKGEAFETEFNGSVVLQSEKLRFEVLSGNDDVEKILEENKKFEAELRELYVTYKAASRQELAAKFEAFVKIGDELKSMEAGYAGLLSGSDPEKLKAAADLAAQRSQPRDKEAIRQEVSASLRRSGELNSDIKTIQASFAEWQKKFQTIDKLNDMLGDKKSELKEVEKELAEFPPLPEQFADAAVFIKEYESAVERSRQIQNDLQKFHIEMATLNARKSEKTVEELTEEVADLTKAFETAKRQGDAYLLIRSELELVRKQYDGNTLEPLRAAISDLFGKMTGGKYEIPRLDEYVPAEISGKAGVLNINLLSTGTLDALALAVRLAMAKELLSGRQGFVIMDDPLINLDPDRKKASAEAIKSFATDGRQVVLFTCDPEHARLFGVNAVQLGEANMGKEPG